MVQRATALKMGVELCHKATTYQTEIALTKDIVIIATGLSCVRMCIKHLALLIRALLVAVFILQYAECGRVFVIF